MCIEQKLCTDNLSVAFELTVTIDSCKCNFLRYMANLSVTSQISEIGRLSKQKKSLIVNQDTSYRVQIISIIHNFERTFILEQFVNVL